MKNRIALLIVLAVVLLTVTVAGVSCGSTTPQQAKTQMQNDLQDLQTTLQGMLNPTVYTSVDNFNTAWKQVEDSFNAVVKSAKDVKNVSVDNLQSAFNDVKKAVGNIGSKESLQTKASDIMDALTNFQKAWQETFSNLSKTQ
jgi:ElaB/YqjD/DUF883 family membrane-anchored ribosome-binding protein